MASNGHQHSTSISQNHKAQLANAYNELGKELSSHRIRVVGNYTLGKVIGEGTYGKVRLGVHRLTGTRVAIKQIPKAMSASLTREIHHHRQMHHPHVTQLYEVIATESNIWLVTELCSGGELFDYLAEKGRLNEAETRVIFGQLCLAVAYVHDKGIVHRDLKLENVLLDERCRVKLGDFGFTREFERGMLLETFCGTTGYASPEMLLGKKYLGPEVDIWSLGIILYTLLTGTLPFDDDDESVMKEMVIRGVFEDPEWLSDEARDLIKSILQADPSARPSIAQILSHPWFTIVSHAPIHAVASQNSILVGSRPPSPPALRPAPPADKSQLPSASSGTSGSTYVSASSDFPSLGPATSGDVSANRMSVRDVGEGIIKPGTSFFEQVKAAQTPSVVEEDLETLSEQEEDSPPAPSTNQTPSRPSFSRSASNSNGSSKVPPAYPPRTPARTKRRSVSSTLSDPSTPTFDKSTHVPPQDFSSLLGTPAPIIFSTPLERDLLNSLSNLGLDTGQIVHSVLSDACDATGALWWMLKRKAERKTLEEGTSKPTTDSTEVPEDLERHDVPETEDRRSPAEDRKTASSSAHTSHEIPPPVSAALGSAHSAPELAFIPPTPTVANIARPTTPPRTKSPNNALLTPSSSVVDTSGRSHPSTPIGSLNSSNTGSKGRKNRSGSVSIMQRATTALEAAGLVRKKSTEAVREEKEREKEKRAGSGEDSRPSHGSGSSRAAKTPPLRMMKDAAVPATPPSSTDLTHARETAVGSPWTLAGSKQSQSPPATESPNDTLSALPNIPGSKIGTNRNNRASLLSAFRMWFKEDPKGKRKEVAIPTTSHSYSQALNSSSVSPVQGRTRGSVKRRTSGSRSKFDTGRKAQRAKRASVSSRRSSSVNSRRSSVHSAQFQMMESPPYSADQIASMSRQRSDSGRRSFGSHTPNSEREEYISRPSSARSFTNQQRHRKSPSASSAGSMHPVRTASPLPKYHSRGGSGSSTHVVRQMQPTPTPHLRSNSASSVHSLASSRQGSLYEHSESDGRRNSSPAKPMSRRSLEETPRRMHLATAFAAHKRQTPFSNPGGSGYLNSIGRSSWKKSWGLEPPGWQTRSAHPVIEVIAISPAPDAPLGIRDVFSGRQSLSMGDESDWVDEEDDGPGYAGGLGQMPTTASSSISPNPHISEPPLLAPAPRGRFGRGAGKRSASGSASSSSSATGRATRGKTGRSPVGRSSPLPMESSFEQGETRAGRRQLPTGRSGPAFRHAIQEEDEGEEE